MDELGSPTVDHHHHHFLPRWAVAPPDTPRGCPSPPHRWAETTQRGGGAPAAKGGITSDTVAVVVNYGEPMSGDILQCWRDQDTLMCAERLVAS